MSIDFDIPRALSVDPADAGYRPDALDIGIQLTIYLDGAQQSHVTAYDQDTGNVTRCVLDAHGCAQADPSSPGDIWMETVAGVVEVKRRKVDLPPA